jgi:hypothetical protein
VNRANGKHYRQALPSERRRRRRWLTASSKRGGFRQTNAALPGTARGGLGTRYGGVVETKPSTPLTPNLLGFSTRPGASCSELTGRGQHRRHLRRQAARSAPEAKTSTTWSLMSGPAGAFEQALPTSWRPVAGSQVQPMTSVRQPGRYQPIGGHLGPSLAAIWAMFRSSDGPHSTVLPYLRAEPRVLVSPG